MKLETLYKPDLIALRWNKKQATDEKRKRGELTRVWKPRLQTYHKVLGFSAALGALVLLGQGLPMFVLAHGAGAAIAWHYDFRWFAAAALLMMLVRMLRRSQFRFRTSFWLPLAITGASCIRCDRGWNGGQLKPSLVP